MLCFAVARKSINTTMPGSPHTSKFLKRNPKSGNIAKDEANRHVVPKEAIIKVILRAKQISFRFRL